MNYAHNKSGHCPLIMLMSLINDYILPGYSFKACSRQSIAA